MPRRLTLGLVALGLCVALYVAISLGLSQLNDSSSSEGLASNSSDLSSSQDALRWYDPRRAPLIRDIDSVVERAWLAEGQSNACDATPCLVLRQSDEAVVIEMTEFDDESESPGDVLLETTVSLTNTDELFAIVGSHSPRTGLEDDLLQRGVELRSFQANQELYRVDGSSWPFQTATIELPYGVLGQWFFNAFFEVDRAHGNETAIDELQEMASIAANEVSIRFGLSELAARSRVPMIVNGWFQALTYAVALTALILTIMEAREPRLRKTADGITDLIPFTGFLGTLWGVAGGLAVLGASDVTDDVAKALALGRIGSSLSLAINTTILAIVVFGIVLIVQYALRSLLEAFLNSSKEPNS